MSESLGDAVLTLKTDDAPLKAGFDRARQNALNFKREMDAVSKASSDAFKNAFNAPGLTQTSESFRSLFTNVQATGQASTVAGDKFRGLFTEIRAGESSTKSLWEQFGNLQSVIGGVLALKVVGWAKDGIKSALDYADSLENLSVATDISVDGLQRLEAIGVTAHVSMDTLARSVEQLHKHLDDPAAQKALEQMGLDYAHIRSLKPEDQFLEIAQAVAALQDPVEKANAGAALFGKTWDQISPAIKGNLKEIADGVSTMSDEQVEALDRAGDAWDRWYLSQSRKLKAFLGDLVSTGEQMQGGMAGYAIAVLTGNWRLAYTAQQAAADLNKQHLTNSDIAKSMPNVLPPKNLLPGGATTPDFSQWVPKIDEVTKAEQASADGAMSWAESLAWVQAHAEMLSHSVDRAFLSVRNLTTAMAAAGPAHIGIPTVAGTRTFGQGSLTINPGTEFERQQVASGPVSIRDAAAANIAAATRAPGIISNLASGVPNAILAAIQGGGSKLQAAGSAIGTSLFGPESSATKAISGGLSKLFGPNSFLTSTLSQAVPVIGALIGPAISGLGKLFSKAFGTAGRDAVRSFADSAGGFDALHKQLAALGSEGEKMWVSLTQGVGRNNPDQAKAVIAGISEKLDAARSTVHQAITDTQTLSERLSHVTEITPELQTALDAALSAKTPQEYAEAVAHIGGVMDTIDAKQQHLESTLTKYGIAWTDAGDAVKKAHIAGESEDIVSAWQEIRGAGVGVFQTMEGMGKSVNDFVHDAQKAGVEVPSSMKEIIQAAIDNGKVFDDNGKKITDIKDLGLIFGDTMETVMKKTIPDAIAKLTTVLEGLAKFLGIDLPKAAEDGAADTQNSLDGITPPDLTVHVKTQFDPASSPDYNNPDNAPPPEGSWRGSFVRPWGLQYLAAGGLAAALATGAFIPRGSDTIPAMLTPGEGVVNTLGMSHLGIDGLRSLNHGEPLATGGTDTSRMEAQLAAVQQELREHTAELTSIRDAVLATRITSIQIERREVARATIDAADNNEGGVRTDLRDVLGIRS